MRPRYETVPTVLDWNVLVIALCTPAGVVRRFHQ